MNPQGLMSPAMAAKKHNLENVKYLNIGVRNPKIVWMGHYFDYGGYSLMSRNYVRGLCSRGYDVGVEAMRGTREITKEEFDYFNAKRRILESGKGIPYLNPDQVKVVAFLPIWNIPKFKKNIIYTMMESKDTNAPFIQRCNYYYDQCWTPTEYNRQDFIRNGIKIPVTVMPIGVDDCYFNEENVIKDMCFNFKVFGKGPDQPSGFKFISVFRWSFRKGFDVLLKSYLRQFRQKDNVSLIIISRHAAMSGDQKFKDAIENDIRKMIGEYGAIDHAPIYWNNEMIEQELMPSVYSLGDAFISTSRGEGFSLPTLEASQMGLPVIAPFHTGFSDYLTKENSYMIDVDEWARCNDVPEWQGWITRDFNGQEFPRFGDKTIEQVMSYMKQSMNVEESKKKNEKMKQLISEKYTWKKCVDRVENQIKDFM